MLDVRYCLNHDLFGSTILFEAKKELTVSVTIVTIFERLIEDKRVNRRELYCHSRGIAGFIQTPMMKS